MNSKKTIQNKIYLLLLLCGILGTMAAFAQETGNSGSNSTYHNQLFFNRFLINPTFSLVQGEQIVPEPAAPQPVCDLRRQPTELFSGVQQ